MSRYYRQTARNIQKDRLADKHGKGIFTVYPYHIFVAAPVLFCARTCLRLYMVIVWVYDRNTGSAVRHRYSEYYSYDANSLTGGSLSTERLPLSDAAHVVASHGLHDSEHPYTQEDGPAKLASDRQQPYEPGKNQVSYT